MKPYFLSKRTLFFAIGKYEFVNEYRKKVQKTMAYSGIRSRHLWFPNCVDTLHICIIEDNNFSTDDSVRHW